MKRLFCILLTVLLLFPVIGAASADIDLSGMSFEELVALKERVMMAIWESEDWQEVRVPQGVYKVGENIPAGKWTITCSEGNFCTIAWGSYPDKNGVDFAYKTQYAYVGIYNPLESWYSAGDRVEYTLECKDGEYIIIHDGVCTFTPYAGTPDLGFKK